MITTDKYQHAAATAAITAVAAAFAHATGVALMPALVLALLAASTAAVTKEWADKVYANNWSWTDLAADVVGMAVGTAVALAIYTLL